jgi:hypothetical protein
MDPLTFVDFLIRAKQDTYASGRAPDSSSRPSSHDLSYSEGELKYIDTYLGGFHFIGEEAVWQNDKPLWGMNYYGKMLAPEFPDGFSEFLKASLMRVPREAPFRGPAEFHAGNFDYRCEWQGDPGKFTGEEEIFYNGEKVYWLAFHGGEIKE